MVGQGPLFGHQKVLAHTILMAHSADWLAAVWKLPSLMRRSLPIIWNHLFWSSWQAPSSPGLWIPRQNFVLFLKACIVLSHKRACLYTLGKVMPSLVLQALSETYTVPLAKFAAAYPTPTLKLHQMFSEGSKSKFPGEGDALRPLEGTLCARFLFKLTTSNIITMTLYTTVPLLHWCCHPWSSTITLLNGKFYCESTAL